MDYYLQVVIEENKEAWFDEMEREGKNRKKSPLYQDKAANL